MSASRERKKRQEFLASGGVDKKAAREAERKKAERKSTILYSTIAVLFVAIAAFLLVYNSGILQRKATAVTIDGVRYTAEDMAFYYYEAYAGFYDELVNNFGTYGPSMVGLDTSTSLKSQNAFNSTEEDAQTWDEYFKEQAVESLRFMTAMKAAADEANYTIDEEDQAYIDRRIEEAKTGATASGLSYGDYLTRLYGSLMTTSCFESNLEDYTLATSYALAYNDSLTYTEEEVNAQYESDPNSYDTVSYIRLAVNGSAPSTTDEEGNTVEPTEEETAAAWAEAQETAQALLDAYEAGEDLEQAVEEYDNATYLLEDNGTYSTTDYVAWCYEDGRTAGDAEIFENEDSHYCYVVIFNDRFRDDTKTVDVRHILINEENFPDMDAEDVTDEQMLELAEEVLASWDGTEDGFAQLAMEYSHDNESNVAGGGLYTNVYQGQMVDSFNDWIFDDARQSGDTGIVQTDYGYHIIYFIGDKPPRWYNNAESALRSEDYNAWESALLEEIGEATIDEKGMNYVGF